MRSHYRRNAALIGNPTRRQYIYWREALDLTQFPEPSNLPINIRHWVWLSEWLRGLSEKGQASWFQRGQIAVLLPLYVTSENASGAPNGMMRMPLW